MGLTVWETQRDNDPTSPDPRTFMHLPDNVYEWKLAGPFESRMRFPAAPMPTMMHADPPLLPKSKKRRHHGRQTRRSDRELLRWLYRDDLSPKPLANSKARKKPRPLGGEADELIDFRRFPVSEEDTTNTPLLPRLPQVAIDGALSHRKPVVRYNWYDLPIHSKEVNFTPPGYRRSQKQWQHPDTNGFQWGLEPMRHNQEWYKEKVKKSKTQKAPPVTQTSRARLNPLSNDDSRNKLAPNPTPPAPPQSVKTPAKSKGATGAEEETPAMETEEGEQSLPPRVGWDPRRHFLQAHFRDLDSWREDNSTGLPCDMRDPNDSFAYNDVIEYMLDNDLMSLTKLRHISKWIDETLSPGFIYDSQKAWFVTMDRDGRRSSSSLSSVSFP